MNVKLARLADWLAALPTLTLIVLVTVRNWNLSRRVRKLQALLGL
ncbi:MAG TPA: hypothetical protein VMV72_18265 [Verrucomicrobiae bacterium]|nr:hypothetical protein [Verrucomicrobiae bacterium]